MYRGGLPGNDILTGLSRRRGGRCSGSRVCCFLGTAEYGIAFVIPGRKTITETLPTSTVLEKERLGGDDLGAVGTGFAG